MQGIAIYSKARAQDLLCRFLRLGFYLRYIYLDQDSCAFFFQVMQGDLGSYRNCLCEFLFEHLPFTRKKNKNYKKVKNYTNELGQ